METLVEKKKVCLEEESEEFRAGWDDIISLFRKLSFGDICSYCDTVDFDIDKSDDYIRGMLSCISERISSEVS